MITLIFGENAYERDSQLYKLISQSFDRYDGLEINTNQLSQIILGVSLFNPSNISVIYSLSENKDLWNFLGENLTDDIISRAEIILIDSKIDKRSKTFKLLQKKANIIECKPLSEKNLSAAKKWLLDFAKSKDIKLLPSAAEEIVEKIFDLTPRGIEKELELRNPKFRYQDLAAFGHIGRTDIDLPWERLNKVEEIKKYL